jgi:hypothetical protein
MSSEASYPPAVWPAGKRFAFTIFDDPDAQTLEQNRLIYSFLADLGLSTTIGVWPAAPASNANSGGETCANPEYRDHMLQLQSKGFEIGYHNAGPQDSRREETIQALEDFRSWFGSYPASMANHYNAEALYWADARISGLQRAIYLLAQRANRLRASYQFTGHVPESEYFWGDIAARTIRYCRNFVFRDINTLRACPQMPYHDPDRAYVPLWYASSDGNRCSAFLETVSEANQDRLEEEGGGCIMYVHFGHGFVENGRLNTRFAELMKRLSRKPGWFAPVTPTLDHLAAQGRGKALSRAERARLERAWLWLKLRGGTF